MRRPPATRPSTAPWWGLIPLMGKLQELLQKHGVQEVYMECEQLSVAQARRFEEAFQKVGVQAVLDSTLDNAIREPADDQVPRGGQED